MQNTKPPSADFSDKPKPDLPHTYPRRVLLAVSGLSPQIVTETIYALAKGAEQPSFVPTEVHLITTREGAQKAELSLLSGDLGWFHRLRVDLNLPEITFSRQQIHIIEDAMGRPMDDIRSQGDNRAAADFITAKVRSFTADPDCALHVSIAGGRKTMGFFLGYALSLYGRDQDRLSHVLVSEPFENNIDFFYPTPYSRVLKTRDERLYDAATAEVTLADIPFVSLRHGLPKALLSGQATFNESVQAARASLAPPRLVLNPDRRIVKAGSVTVKLPPAELALLSVFARRVVNGEGPLPAPPKEGDADTEWARLYIAEYERIVREIDNTGATMKALVRGMDGAYFSTRKTKLNDRLKAALGPAAHAYLIQDGGVRPRLFGLSLPADAVYFESDVAFKEDKDDHAE